MTYDGRVVDGDHGSDTAAESDVRSLREVRADGLLSLLELASLADVAPSTIYLIEAGRTTPRLSVIRRLCSALAVEPWEVAEFRRAIRARGAPG